MTSYISVDIYHVFTVENIFHLRIYLCNISIVTKKCFGNAQTASNNQIHLIDDRPKTWVNLKSELARIGTRVACVRGKHDDLLHHETHQT